VTYEEIMQWYQQRKRAGLTIEPEQIQRPLHSSTTEQSLCDTCRWHIPNKWGSDYCHGGRKDCHEWMMYRADDYYDPDDDPWEDWRRKDRLV
jgi:hypothetical protein